MYPCCYTTLLDSEFCHCTLNLIFVFFLTLIDSVLCVTESWLNPFVQDSMLSIDEYNILRADRTADSDKTTGGGIIVYYMNTLDVSLVSDHASCTPNGEILWLNLQLKQTSPQYIGVVYRPPDGDYNILTDILQEHLTNLNTRIYDRILIGDMNVDLLKPREPKTRCYVDFYRRLGLTSLIEGVMHHGVLHDSSLDHICVNRPGMFEEHGIIDINSSDHNLIFVARKQPKIEKSFRYI